MYRNSQYIIVPQAISDVVCCFPFPQDNRRAKNSIKQGTAYDKSAGLSSETKINKDEKGGGDNRSSKTKGKKMADARTPGHRRKHDDSLGDDISEEDGKRNVRGMRRGRGRGSGERYLDGRSGAGRDTRNRSGGRDQGRGQGRSRGPGHDQDRDRERRGDGNRVREQRRGDRVPGRGRGQGQSRDGDRGRKDVKDGGHQKRSNDTDIHDTSKTKNKPTKRGVSMKSSSIAGTTATVGDRRLVN